MEPTETQLANALAALTNEAAGRAAAEAELAKVQDILHAHQDASDAITAGAESVLASGASAEVKLALLSKAIQRAKVFSSGREAARKLAEAADLEAQAAALKAEAAAIFSPAS